MIVVTGATGTVGRLLVEQLVGAGAEVRAVSRKPRAGGPSPGVEFARADPMRPGVAAHACAFQGGADRWSC